LIQDELESGLEKGPDDEAQEAHTEEQIIAILKEHEVGVKTADLCRKHGISEASFYNCKAKYGGFEVSEAKRLKGLESENARSRCQERGCRSPAFCVRYDVQDDWVPADDSAVSVPPTGRRGIAAAAVSAGP
jgi:putative transposase